MNKTKSVTIQNMLKGLKKGGETLRLALILVVVCICMAVIDASTFYTGPNFLNIA